MASERRDWALRVSSTRTAWFPGGALSKPQLPSRGLGASGHVDTAGPEHDWVLLCSPRHMVRASLMPASESGHRPDHGATPRAPATSGWFS